MLRRVLPALVLPAMLAAQPVRHVPRGEIVEAMQRQRAQGYDILATSNASRFSGGFLLDLARRATGPFLLEHHDYFEALLQAAGITRDKAPVFARMTDEIGEDQFVDPRPEKVIRKITEGEAPKLAVNVVSGWRSGAKGEYSFDDLTASPHLRVVHKRISSYRIVDFGDAVLFDEVLGAMFKVIGDGAPSRSFAAYAADGVSVMRTTAKKGIVTITETATVQANGQGQKGVPANRPDLVRLEERVKRPFQAVYVPLSEDPDRWGKP